MNSLPTKNILNSLIQSQQGEICFIEDEQCYYIYDGEAWSPIEAKVDGDGVNISLYELNKSIIGQLPVLEGSEIGYAIDNINTYTKTVNNTFYLLLCREYNYYTLFNTGGNLIGFPTVGDGVFGCLENVGDVISVDYSADGAAVEIWVMVEEEPMFFVLFGYDEGVVQIG